MPTKQQGHKALTPSPTFIPGKSFFSRESNSPALGAATLDKKSPSLTTAQPEATPEGQQGLRSPGGLQPPLGGLQAHELRAPARGQGSPRPGVRESPAPGGTAAPRAAPGRREAPGTAGARPVLTFLPFLPSSSMSPAAAAAPAPPGASPQRPCSLGLRDAAGRSSPASVAGSSGHGPPGTRCPLPTRPQAPQRHRQLFNPAAILGGGFPACPAPRPGDDVSPPRQRMRRRKPRPPGLDHALSAP